ncbi:MAG: sulfotransferase [Phycisphaerales bacterium JB059]
MAPSADMLLRQGDKLVRAGDHAGALEVYTKFLRTQPRHTSRRTISLRAGQLMLLTGKFDQAVSHFKKMADADRRDTDALYNLAQAQAYAMRLEEATRTVERLLAVDLDHPEGLARMATFLNYAGRPEEGEALLDEAGKRGVKHWSIELAFAGLAPRIGRMEEAVTRMRGVVDAGGLDREEHADLLFNIGYLLDKLERYDEAWEAVSAGNRIHVMPWDPEGFVRSIDRIIETQDAGAIRALPEPIDPASDAVLVLGSPRSGTTLIEQILSAHPEAETAGELGTLRQAVIDVSGSSGGVPEDPKRIRQVDMIKASGAYLSELRPRTGKARRRVDKCPGNWQFLGTGSRILPQARVIHSVRDPRDTAISCFFRHFVAGHAFTTRLDWLGHYLACERKLMRHWARVLPEGSPRLGFTTANYEQIVENPETEARRLVEFAGLPWDDACLRFGETKKIVNTLNADQAGRGVYTGSTQRWRRYEKHLAPLLEAMGDEAPTD